MLNGPLGIPIVDLLARMGIEAPAQKRAIYVAAAIIGPAGFNLLEGDYYVAREVAAGLLVHDFFQRSLPPGRIQADAMLAALRHLLDVIEEPDTATFELQDWRYLKVWTTADKDGIHADTAFDLHRLQPCFCDNEGISRISFDPGRLLTQLFQGNVNEPASKADQPNDLSDPPVGAAQAVAG